MQSSQQGMYNSSAELAKLRGENKEAEGLLRRLQEQLRAMQKALDQAQQQNKDLGNQVPFRNRSHEKVLKTKDRFDLV